MRSSLEDHNGMNVFMSRYDHMSADEVKKEVEEVRQYMLSAPDDSVVVLVDVTGTKVTSEILDLFKSISHSANKKMRVKTAIVGLYGPSRVYLDLVSKFTNSAPAPFDSKQEALDWLVS